MDAFLGLRPVKREMVANYFTDREERRKAEGEIPTSAIFSKCVFFILGFTGRGSDSRLQLVRDIERNGGSSVLFMCGSVTHVVTRHLCARKKKQLEKDMKNRRLYIVTPEYIKDCAAAGKRLHEEAYFLQDQQKLPMDAFVIKTNDSE